MNGAPTIVVLPTSRLACKYFCPIPCLGKYLHACLCICLHTYIYINVCMYVCDVGFDLFLDILRLCKLSLTFGNKDPPSLG